MRRPWLCALLGATLGTVAAVVTTETLGMAAFAPGLVRRCIGIAIAALLGAFQGALLSRLFPGGTKSWRIALTGALFAGLFALLLVRAATVWVNLSVFGGAPAGELAFLMLPVTQGLTGAVVGSLVGARDA